MAEYIAENGLQDSKEMAKLYSTAVMYKNMGDFINDIVLGREGDVVRSGGKEAVNNCVSLMTFHAAKGLEFPVVFLAGINNGTVPYVRYNAECDRDEEQRLFYVGLTRAEDEIIITAGKDSSYFLDSISEKLIEREKADELKKSTAKQLTLF